MPGLGRSAGEGKGYPLQYSGLENPMYSYPMYNVDCIAHEVAKSRTLMSDFNCTTCTTRFAIAFLPRSKCLFISWL